MSLGLTVGVAAACATVAAGAADAISAAVATDAITALNGLGIGSSTIITIIGDRTSIVVAGGSAAGASAAGASAAGIVTVAAGAGAAIAAGAAGIVSVAAVRSLQELAAGYDCTQNRSVSTWPL